MAVLKVLGSCSGTEPMQGRLHTSVVLTVNDRNYFFDAGECCSVSAHLGGVDLCKTRAVFISHTHYDHIGGLTGLFWTVRKLNSRYKTPVADGGIKLFIPDTVVWEHIHGTLKGTEGNFKTDFSIDAAAPHFGVFYEDEALSVSGFESHHLKPADDGHCRAYSYRVEVGGKTLVYSGDVRDMNDLVETVGAGCDVLLCETGHHKVKDVCDFAESRNIGHLVLFHHGREILEGRPTADEAIAACRIPVTVSFDGYALEI